jgi:hypothetical protein
MRKAIKCLSCLETRIKLRTSHMYVVVLTECLYEYATGLLLPEYSLSFLMLCNRTTKHPNYSVATTSHAKFYRNPLSDWRWNMLSNKQDLLFARCLYVAISLGGFVNGYNEDAFYLCWQVWILALSTPPLGAVYWALFPACLYCI